MEPIRLFIGLDKREAAGTYVFIQSLLETTKAPVNLTIITEDLAKGFGIGTDGSNAFSLSRFLVPALCGYQGQAIWMDGNDMMLREDLEDLWKLRQSWYAVQVAKHPQYEPTPRKYIGTELESDNPSYPKKNWSSVIVWDCNNYMNRCLTPEYIKEKGGKHLHRFEWLPEERVGEIPLEWNHLVTEQPLNISAKNAHFTLGIPGFTHYAQCDFSGEWRNHLRKAQRGL